MKKWIIDYAGPESGIYEFFFDAKTMLENLQDYGRLFDECLIPKGQSSLSQRLKDVEHVWHVGASNYEQEKQPRPVLSSVTSYESGRAMVDILVR